MTPFHLTKRLSLMALALISVGPVPSQAKATGSDDPDDSMWLASSDRQLDSIRGGFDFGEGLLVSFGINRVVYINDRLVTSMSFNTGLMHSLTPSQFAMLNQQFAGKGAQVVQSGSGNTIDPASLTVPLASFIQNTVSNQRIRTETVIQATTNGLGMLKGMNLQNMINEAVANAIGNR
jgi:hypothetical protein